MDTSTSFRLRSSVRRFNRLRWFQKAKNVGQYPRYGSSADRLRYILTSPEVGDFSWRIRDVDQVARDLAVVLDEPDVARVRYLLEEAKRSLHDAMCVVRNLITGAVSTAEEEDVQICVSAPVGDIELAL